MISVTKVIRVKDQTFDKLTEHGKWSDTMDTIVSRLLKYVPVESPAEDRA
jgi:hypothetical protein